MKNVRILAGAMLCTLAGAAAAGNDDWVGRVVRVEFGADHALIGGKAMRTDGCLYVLLDAPRDGISLVRMDQVNRLLVRGGAAWAAQDVRSVLAREPAHCHAEANG